MRVAIISGGRDYRPTPEDLACLDATLELHDVTHVIHGACEGVDMDCHRHLKERRVWLIAMPAPWAWKGKGAGPARNKEMSNLAHWMTDANAWEPARPPVWILFPGGRGTDNARGLATHDGFQLVEIGGGDA